MTDHKHNRVYLTIHRGKAVLDVGWPDNLRNRIRVPAEENRANEMRLRVELAIADGTWANLRQTLLEKKTPELLKGSFSAVADEYFKDWVEVRNRSVKCKRSYLSRFKQKWGVLPIRALGVRLVDSYVAARKGEVKSATVNRELACLKHLLAWATKRGFLLANPLIGYEKLKEELYARERATAEMIEAVLSKLPPLFEPVYTLIWQTAARRGEVLDLEHPQVDRKNRIIEFTRRTKSGKSRLVMITDRAMEAIDAIPPLPGCPYVFYNPETGTRWTDCRKPWDMARKAAGYPWMTPKHLRPAFATDLSEMGLETHFVSELLGHSSVAVTEKFYIKRRQVEACRQALRVIEGGKRQAS